MGTLIASCSFEGHPSLNIVLASGSFNLGSSILPAQVTSNQPANLRVVFDYLSDHFGETHTYYVWNALYRKYVYSLGLDSIDLLASNDILHGIIKDFDMAYPGTLIWESGNLTIEDLLGHLITQSGYHTITFDLVFNWFINWDRYYCVPIIPGCYWEHDWPGSCRPASISECIIESLAYTVYVNVPIPPPPPPSHPAFVSDLCGLSITPTTPVAPNQKFNIKVTIENQSESSGSYVIGYYCEANYGELATGTIGGSLAKKSHTFSVTPNQLAHRSITESQILYFTIVVENEEGKETDRWTPAGIAVIVTTPPPPVGTADLSGLVTDKQTGDGIDEVSVTTTGYSASTDSSGNYTLNGLATGSYNIKFSKAGYSDVTKPIKLVSGQNTLDVTMTSSTGAGKPPWALIGAGAVAIVGIVLVTSGLKKGEGK